MKRNGTETVRTLLLAVTLVLSASCQDVMVDTVPSSAHEVGLYAGGSQTRTEMLPDGLGATWTAGDKIALWARNSAGSYTLSNQIFQTYGLDSKRGFFTSTLSEAMPQDTYTYMCAYPQPVLVDGTLATFTLSSLQDGKVSGGADIMIATPHQHGALTAIPDPDDHSNMSMKMNRMLHQFRFFVPADDALLGEDKIERILLTFPRDVVGNLTFDVENPDIAPVLSESTGSVVMRLASPIGVSTSDAEYACLALAPTQFSEGESMQIKAYTSASKIAYFDPVDLCARSFEAGHSTPVILKIREIGEYPYSLIFRITANNLGEDIKQIRFIPSGDCVWHDGTSGEYVYTDSALMGAGYEIIFRFDSKESYESFSGENMTIEYESEHAIVSQTLNIGEVVAEGEMDQTEVSLTIPYLFEEDFSSLIVYDGTYSGGTETSIDGASEPALDLSQYGLSSGWSGARTGCTAAGTAIIVGSRVDYVILGATRGYGRLDSPQLNKIKSDVITGIRVTFDYSGSRRGNSFYQVGVCGCTYQEGLLNGYATQFNNSVAWSGISDYVEIPNIPTSGSVTSTNMSMTYNLSECTNKCRLTWHVVGMGTTVIGNGNQYLYIDNIKVQIEN